MITFISWEILTTNWNTPVYNYNLINIISYNLINIISKLFYFSKKNFSYNLVYDCQRIITFISYIITRDDNAYYHMLLRKLLMCPPKKGWNKVFWNSLETSFNYILWVSETQAPILNSFGGQKMNKIKKHVMEKCYWRP